MKCTAPFLLFYRLYGSVSQVRSIDRSVGPLFDRSVLSLGRSVSPLDRSWPVRQPAFGPIRQCVTLAGQSGRPGCRPCRMRAAGSCGRGHAALKWSCRPDSAVAAGPDDERGGRITGRPALLVGCCANQKATVSPLIVTLPKTAVALSLLLPLLTATPRQRVSGSPPSNCSVRTLPKVAPPSSE